MNIFYLPLNHMMSECLDVSNHMKMQVTFPYMGEFRWTSLVDMSNMALCLFIQFIPRMTIIPCPIRMIRLVLNNLLNNSSGTFWAIWPASTRLLDVLITYGTPNATSVNISLLAHVELTKLYDALESNNIMMGRSLRKNVPVSTSSPVGISSMVV
jgi:hypothetical protein